MYAAKGRSHTGVDYRYYVCKNRFHDGKEGCDHPRIAATEIEPIIVDRVRQICHDEALRADVAARLDKGKTVLAEELGIERAKVQNRIDTLNREARTLLQVIKESGSKGSRTVTERLGELETEIDTLRQNAGRLDEQLRGLSESVGRVATAINLLDSFDDLWEALIPEERVDLLALLIDRIEVDEPAGKLELRLHDLAAPFPPLDDAAGAEA
jgi:prefoldin subunit 5